MGEVDIARPADLDIKPLSLISLRVCNGVIGGLVKVSLMVTVAVSPT